MGKQDGKDKYVKDTGNGAKSSTDLAQELSPVDRRFRVIVHRLNVERENADLPISVNLVGRKRRVFNPGEPTILYGYHIEILRNAVEDNEFEVPSESAAYESINPIKIAEANFPGYRARVRDEDGVIILTKRVPMYSVEILEELPPTN